MAISIKTSASARRPIVVSEPQLIGYFSVDEDRNYLPDSSKLMYYKPPGEGTVHLDLNHGIGSSIRHSGPSGERGFLFKWMNSNRHMIEAPARTNKLIQPKFVCTRGMLTKLLRTPFDTNKGWTINAAKWNDTIYLSSAHREYIPPTDDERRFTSWGYKFAQYTLSDSADTPPNIFMPVIESQTFFGVFQRCIGDNSVLFSSTIKGIQSETRVTEPLVLKNLELVDVMTNRVIDQYRVKRSFNKFKLLNSWSQGFLINTTKFLCGFRDDTGIVRELRSYSIDEMVQMGRYHWNPMSCINFCDAFLTKVSETVVNDYDETIYRFERTPAEDFIHVQNLPPSEENNVPLPFQLEGKE